MYFCQQTLYNCGSHLLSDTACTHPHYNWHGPQALTCHFCLDFPTLGPKGQLTKGNNNIPVEENVRRHGTLPGLSILLYAMQAGCKRSRACHRTTLDGFLSSTWLTISPTKQILLSFRVLAALKEDCQRAQVLNGHEQCSL
jgi:hypothetical protein